MPVFPWSMSDFKPGDRIFMGCMRAVSQLLRYRLPFCSDAFSVPIRIDFPNKSKSGFSMSGEETPGAVVEKIRTGVPCGTDDEMRRPPTTIRRRFFVAVKEKIRIRIKGYDHQLVDQSAEKIVQTAKRTGARVSGPVPLPTEKQVITILRAVHKYKDSREQFEMRTHKRLIDILKPSNKTVEALMGLELPAGVDIEIKL